MSYLGSLKAIIFYPNLSTYKNYSFKYILNIELYAAVLFKFRIHVFGIIFHRVATYYQIQGKFYELYEIDAEIGHKELDWKMTFSGVGKCRQVTSC